MHSKILSVAPTVNKYIDNFDPKDECTAKLIFSLNRNYSCLTTPVSNHNLVREQVRAEHILTNSRGHKQKCQQWGKAMGYGDITKPSPQNCQSEPEQLTHNILSRIKVEFHLQMADFWIFQEANTQTPAAPVTSWKRFWFGCPEQGELQVHISVWSRVWLQSTYTAKQTLRISMWGFSVVHYLESVPSAPSKFHSDFPLSIPSLMKWKYAHIPLCDCRCGSTHDLLIQDIQATQPFISIIFRVSWKK